MLDHACTPLLLIPFFRRDLAAIRLSSFLPPTSFLSSSRFVFMTEREKSKSSLSFLLSPSSSAASADVTLESSLSSSSTASSSAGSSLLSSGSFAQSQHFVTKDEHLLRKRKAEAETFGQVVSKYVFPPSHSPAITLIKSQGHRRQGRTEKEGSAAKRRERAPKRWSRSGERCARVLLRFFYDGLALSHTRAKARSFPLGPSQNYVRFFILPKDLKEKMGFSGLQMPSHPSS